MNLFHHSILFIVKKYCHNLKKVGCFIKLYILCKNENKSSPISKHVCFSHVLPHLLWPDERINCILFETLSNQKRKSITSFLKLKELDVGLLGMERN